MTLSYIFILACILTAYFNNIKISNPMTATALLDTDYINTDKPPFILVDGSYYMFRNFHALPVTMQTTQGLHTNSIRGTLNALKN